jgi:diamine N-acetyltransferase
VKNFQPDLNKDPGLPNGLCILIRNLLNSSLMDTMIIRKATVDDAAFISLLARITFSETYSHLITDRHALFEYYSKFFSVARIRASLQDDNNIFLLAINEELPVGYAKLKKQAPTPFIDSTKCSQLQHIYVLQDFVAKRIGQLLINQVFEEISKLRNDYCWVSLYKGNERAIRFYEKKQFYRVGTHTHQIGKQVFDFIVLKKDMD